MTTPESPLDKKESVFEEELTMPERVSRLEHVVENAYNQLGKYIHETELKFQKEGYNLQTEISKTLTLMNMSILQNIVAIRETVKALIAKNVLDQTELDKAITDELAKAIEAQQKIVSEVQEAYEKEKAQTA
jgi:hypothetical protein